jgi:DNA-binding MarR family transcriptional regulator
VASAPLPFDPIEEAARQWRTHGWDDAADGMAAITSVMRAQAIMLARAVVGSLRLGLSFARYELLTLLSFTRRGNLSMARAGTLLQVHPTSITNSVSRLEKAELVRRDPHPSDGRAFLIQITEQGRALGAEATKHLNTALFTQPGLPPQQLRTLFDVIRDLRHEAGDFT